MAACREALRDAGHEMEFTIRTGDFVLEQLTPSADSFDLVIMNPPYYKVRKDSDQARAMAHIVYGQPNIYAFFLAVAADLLRDGGELVAITPRSYFNGPYFQRFRKWFFERMAARQIHLFESRTDVFQEDDVLQESVILLAARGARPKEVILTSSAGRSFQELGRHVLPYTRVLADSSGGPLIRVATSRFEQEILEALDGAAYRFRELPLEISTGPVVTFRSREFLRRGRAADTAPLLWMHNVRPFVTRFPLENGKPAHILVSERSQRLLLPARRYVLLKRFTAKEERKRLVAGILEPEDCYGPFVGLENHLNYVYRPDGELSRVEALGLAALFESVLIDRYFRAISGNTQVNAAEVRALPVPCLETIQEIGRDMQRSRDRNSRRLERLVGEALGLPGKLIEQLCEEKYHARRSDPDHNP
jgi:adenine-specific DNA-methyltransferase